MGIVNLKITDTSDKNSPVYFNVSQDKIDRIKSILNEDQHLPNDKNDNYDASDLDNAILNGGQTPINNEDQKYTFDYKKLAEYNSNHGKAICFFKIKS